MLFWSRLKVADFDGWRANRLPPARLGRYWKKLSTPLAGHPTLIPDGKPFIVVTSGSEVLAHQTHVGFLLNFPMNCNAA